MNENASPTSDFRPSAAWRNIRLRADLLSKLRDFFNSRDFLEVSTPLLSADTVIDRHLDPLRVTLFDDPRDPDRGRPMFLQTSPEFHMKRLLATGSPSIYQITRAFRGCEQGALHNPEFTILEWYGRDHTMSDGVQLLDELAQMLFNRGKCQRATYREAFLARTNLDPLICPTSQLVQVAGRFTDDSASATQRLDRDTLLDLVFSLAIQPNLGMTGPVILYDYPASQAALSRLGNQRIPTARRFELFVDGLELANGYDELREPDELRCRNSTVNNQRQDDGKPPLPSDSQLLAAMESGLPACTGVALGVDRVVMLLAGASSLDEVIAFPIDRA